MWGTLALAQWHLPRTHLALSEMHAVAPGLPMCKPQANNNFLFPAGDLRRAGFPGCGQEL